MYYLLQLGYIKMIKYETNYIYIFQVCICVFIYIYIYILYVMSYNSNINVASTPYKICYLYYAKAYIKCFICQDFLKVT